MRQLLWFSIQLFLASVSAPLFYEILQLWTYFFTAENSVCMALKTSQWIFIIYGGVSISLLLGLLIFAFRIKKTSQGRLSTQSGQSIKLYKLVWSLKSIYFPAIRQITDTLTDISVLGEWFELTINNPNDGDYLTLLILSIIVFVGYRVYSSYYTFMKTKSIIRSILQFLLDFDIYYAIYIHIKLNKYKSLGFYVQIRGNESIYESMPQILLQSIFFFVINNKSPILIVSTALSLFSTIKYFIENDGNVAVDKAVNFKYKVSIVTQQSSNTANAVTTHAQISEPDFGISAGATTTVQAAVTPSASPSINAQVSGTGSINSIDSIDLNQTPAQSKTKQPKPTKATKSVISWLYVNRVVFRISNVWFRMCLYVLLWLFSSYMIWVCILFGQCLFWIFLYQRPNKFAWYNFVPSLIAYRLFVPKWNDKHDGYLQSIIISKWKIQRKYIWIVQWMDSLILFIIAIVCHSIMHNSKYFMINGNSNNNDIIIVSFSIYVALYLLVSPFWIHYSIQDIIVKTQSSLTGQKKGRFSLASAAASRNIEEFKGMLAFGWDLYFCDNDNRTILHYACQGGDREIVDITMNQFPQMLQHPNEHGLTPFDIACINGRADVIQLLLTQYSDQSFPLLTKHQNKAENTPLHLAANHGRDEVIRLLLEIGANHVDPNLKNKFGATPLALAKEKKAPKCIALLESAASVK